VLLYRREDWNIISRLLSNSFDADGKNSAYLRTLLPSALVQQLQHNPQGFASAIAADADTPELIWSSEMRLHMQDQLDKHVQMFKSRLHSNPSNPPAYQTSSPIRYEALEKEVVIEAGNRVYYLRNLVDQQRFGGWEIVAPETVLAAVCCKLGQGNETLLLRTVALLFTRYRSHEAFANFNGFGELLNQLSTNDEDIIIAAADAIQRAAGSSTANVTACSKANGISALTTVLLKYINSASNRVVPSILAAIETVVSSTEGRAAVVQQTQLIPALLQCALRSDGNASLKALMHLANMDVLQQAMYKAGAVILLLVPPLRAITTQDSSLMETAQLSIQTLARLVGSKDGKQVAPENTFAWNALQSLLTRPLAEKLRKSNAVDVLRDLGADHNSAVLMWNSHTRAELMAYIESQMAALRTTPFPDQITFAYKAHSAELQVDGIFLKAFIAKPSSLESPHSFAGSLLNALTSPLQPAQQLQVLSALHLVLFTQRGTAEHLTTQLLRIIDLFSGSQSVAVMLKALHVLSCVASVSSFAAAVASTSVCISYGSYLMFFREPISHVLHGYCNNRNW